jgi:hypothetical protein
MFDLAGYKPGGLAASDFVIFFMMVSRSLRFSGRLIHVGVVMTGPPKLLQGM